jgi:hypothetical protein
MHASRQNKSFSKNVPGFRSYVGQVMSVMRDETMIDMEYDECGTDDMEVTDRCCFSPSTLYNISPINKFQREKLLSSKIHSSFNAFEQKKHKVKFLLTL